MTEKPLVSAITIFFNAATFLREAIESVLAQTYADWELLLVDDGSTDGSTDLALSYARMYPQRIRYLEHEGHRNRGMSATRNLGIAHARGEYIALLDADDVWLPLKLERQVAFLESDPESAMVFGATQYWHSWTGRPEDVGLDYVPDVGVRELTRFEPPSLLTRVDPLGRMAGACVCGLLIRSAVIRSLGGFVESFTGLYEDQALFMKVYLSQRVLVSEQTLDRYRIHPGSCCAMARESGQAGAIRRRFLDWLDAYLQAQQKRQPMEEVEEALRQCSELRRDLESSNGWNRLLRVAEGFEARLQVASDVFDWVRVDIARISEGSDYDIQLDLSHFQLSADQRYLLSFLARADAPRAVGVGVAQGHAPWVNLGFYERLALNESWQFFQRSFVATAEEENGRIQFDLGESIASVELSQIKLRNDTEGDLAQPASPPPTSPDRSATLRQKC